VGQGRLALHARLRRRGGLACAADGQEANRGAAADRVGHGQIVERVVAERLDERRLQGLVAIGVDEISYRRHQRYLTSVVDHRSGAIVWCSPGRNAETLKEFFDLLGERRHSIRAVSIDMSGGYEKAIRQCIPQAEIAFDPFHVVRLAERAVDQVAAMSGMRIERSHTLPRDAGSRARAGRC
jgi:transposase